MATCYGNSLLQVFNHTPALINHIKNHSSITILKDYYKLLEHCHVTEQRIDPDHILKLMMEGHKDLHFGKFNDTSELLMHIIDMMPEDQNIFKDLFCCENTTVHRCKHCGDEWRLETDQHVRVTVGRTLTGVLAEMSREKDVDGQRTCNKCEQSRDCTEKFVIDKAPPVLNIKLATSDDTYSGKEEKTYFPERINIRPYMSEKTGKAVVYELYAVVVYQPGHYYAYCKAPNGSWNICNDSYVMKVSLEKKVLSCIATSLFYQRSPESDSTWDFTNEYLNQEEQMAKVHRCEQLLKKKNFFILNCL